MQLVVRIPQVSLGIHRGSGGVGLSGSMGVWGVEGGELIQMATKVLTPEQQMEVLNSGLGQLRSASKPAKNQGHRSKCLTMRVQIDRQTDTHNYREDLFC